MSRRTAPAQPCRHCGKPIYLPQLRRHEHHCSRITELLGTPQEMIRQFRKVRDLLVIDFVARYPYVGLAFMKDRLLWGGLAEEELAGRLGKENGCGYKGGYQAAKRQRYCKRCEIRLAHPSVPEGKEGYCGWCWPVSAAAPVSLSGLRSARAKRAHKRELVRS